MRFGQPTRREPGGTPGFGRLLSLMAPLAVALGFLAWVNGPRGAGPEADVPTAAPPSRNPRVAPFAELKPPDRNILDTFEDGSRHLPERPYYHLLQLARRNPPKAMEEAARADVLPINILEEPERYRGQLFRLKGRVRRIVRTDASENPEGIVEQYESYLYDTGFRPRAAVVITPDAPAGLAPTQDLVENVETVAYFLGMWRHSVQGDKVLQSPLFIAGSIKLRESPKLTGRPQVTVFQGVAITLVSLAVLLGGYFLTRRVGQDARRPNPSQESETEPDFAALISAPPAQEPSPGDNLTAPSAGPASITSFPPTANGHHPG